MKTQLTLLAAVAGLLVARDALAQEAVAPAAVATGAPTQEAIAQITDVGKVSQNDDLLGISPRVPTLALSVYTGKWKFCGSYDAETNKELYYGTQLKLRIFDPHLSIVGRFSQMKGDLPYQDYYGVSISNGTLEEQTASAELRLDLFPSQPFNLYASGGIYYEKGELQYDYYRREYRYIWFFVYTVFRKYREYYEDRGTAPIGHIGIEYQSNPLYLCAEVGVIGKVGYDFTDDDDIEVNLRGTAGVVISQGIRADALAQYSKDGDSKLLWYAVGLSVEI